MPTRSALPVAALKITTFDWWIGMVLSMMPPVIPFIGFGLRVLLDDVDALDDEVRRVDPAQHDAALALVAPAMHDDLVAFANLVHGRRSLQNFRGQRHDLHEPLGAQLARDRSEDAGADGLQLGVQQHGGVAVELDGEPSLRRMPLAVRTTTAL